MPTQVVDVDLQTETGAIAQRTFSDLIVIARYPTEPDPTFNEPRVYDAASQVASEFGSGSDAHESALEIERQGARQFWVVMLETEEHSETLGDSDTESTQEGEVENTPMLGGDDNIDVTVDGVSVDNVFTTVSPPEEPDEGEAAINTDTGEIHVGDETTGQDAGIQVEYLTSSFDAAEPELTEGRFDLAILADTRADRSYIGELSQLNSWIEGNEAAMVLAHANGNQYDTDEQAMQAAHAVGGYITSGRVLPIAHKSNDDVGAGFAGRLATKRPWFNPYMDGGADYGFSMESYRKSLIGSPNQPNTFEGGDSEGAGPANVLYREMGSQLLSNSLSTAGADSNYQFFDVARTEAFIVHEVKTALRELRLHRESIPFAPIGRTLIEAKLRDRLNAYVSPTGRALSPEETARLVDDDDGPFFLDQPRLSSDSQANVPLSELRINVPRYDDLPQNDRANRVWSGIRIDATLAGNVHTFQVELAVLV